MMFLGEANDLLKPYLRHPEFKEFENNTSRIQELTEQIKQALNKLDMSRAIGIRCVEVDETTEAAFREFAKICKQGLK